MKERVVTGVIMALVALLGICLLPSWLFQFILLVIALIGVVEWSKMLPQSIRFSYVLINVFLLIIAYVLLRFDNAEGVLLALNASATYLWLAVPFVLLLQVKSPQPLVVSKEMTASFSSLMLLGFYLSLSMLHGLSYGFVLYIIGLVALADSGAYFTGRKFGKNKLAPSISPGKTFEGAIGGISVAMLFAVIVIFFLPETFSNAQKVAFMLISLIAAMLSIAGDLYESLIKRHAGVKDSGTLFPGHGGVLDRIDGLVAGATVFVFGFYLFQMNQ